MAERKVTSGALLAMEDPDLEPWRKDIAEI